MTAPRQEDREATAEHARRWQAGLDTHPGEENVEALADWNDLRFRNKNLGGRMSVPVTLLADALGSLALATDHVCEKCVALTVECGECETRRVVLERFAEWIS